MWSNTEHGRHANKMQAMTAMGTQTRKISRFTEDSSDAR